MIMGRRTTNRARQTELRVGAMKFTEFEHEVLPRILIPLLGGLFLIAAVQTAARAEPSASGARSFIVSAADGYGVNDCIKTGDDCAKIVADAWCEAHGHGGARAYGPAGDMTGSIDKVSAKSLANSSAVASAPAKVIGEDDVYIACGE
jgi:hypothetical protein